jgi:hypothetical protein
MGSPYEIVLGEGLASLHPRLGAYFGEIPPGSVGLGSGRFDRAGTPRRWLWPALWALGRAGIAFPAWEEHVPFSVENRPVVDACGRTAVGAVRTFHFARGDRRMVDAITADGTDLVDHLGEGRRLTARLRASVRGGALTLDSDEVCVRIGSRHVRILRPLAPTVELVERFDDSVGRQHVSVVLRLPVVGRIYEYSGHFDYAITADTPGGTAV